MTLWRRFISLALFAALFAANAQAADFPQTEAYEQYAAEINIADYRARAVSSGIRVLWRDGQFIDADDNRYTPPEWFSADFPAVDIDGLITAANLDDNAIGRILRAPDAHDGWRKLSFIALDLPNADGGFDARQQQLLQMITAANLPNISIAVRAIFSDTNALQTALDAMYKEGGDGYILRHKDGDYNDNGSTRLLVLPYTIGDATVVAHRPGKGEYTGMLGSMEVADKDGGLFIIGIGFSREQRRNPPAVNTQIQFKYKGYTGTGKPKNPVFLRAVPTAAAEQKIGGILSTTHVMWFFIMLMLTLALMDAVTHTAGGRRWNFKSAIVSTGLLGTFVGVFWGLYNFDTADIAAGVPLLLEGLKLSFVTSIVGIALSTVLSVMQTIAGSAD